MLQAALRGCIVRRQYRRLQRAVTTIQRWYRAVMARRVQAILINSSAVLIQARVRGYLARKQFTKLRACALVLQSRWRMHVCRKDYIVLRSSAIRIQTLFRCLLLMKRQSSSYLLMRCAAIKLQAHFRGWRTRQVLRLQHEAAIIIQKNFRCRRQVLFYQTQVRTILGYLSFIV